MRSSGPPLRSPPTHDPRPSLRAPGPPSCASIRTQGPTRTATSLKSAARSPIRPSSRPSIRRRCSRPSASFSGGLQRGRHLTSRPDNLPKEARARLRPGAGRPKRRPATPGRLDGPNEVLAHAASGAGLGGHGQWRACAALGERGRRCRRRGSGRDGPARKSPLRQQPPPAVTRRAGGPDTASPVRGTPRAPHRPARGGARSRLRSPRQSTPPDRWRRRRRSPPTVAFADARMRPP